MIGHWAESPLGPMTDLMWATPGGERRLVASTEEVTGFVSAAYGYDHVEVSRLDLRADDHDLHLAAPDLGLELHLRAGPGWRIPFRRPAWVTRWIEGPVARGLLGVRTYGVRPLLHDPSGALAWLLARNRPR